MHRLIFRVSITCISRALVLRDRLLGRIGPFGSGGRRQVDGSNETAIARCSIASGTNKLDAFFVTPAQGTACAAVLICHGIGETVEHWLPVQRLLAARGTASLVFDYSGYGRSTGRISYAQCELDAIAAFQDLQRRMPNTPVSILGFSLGSGVATAVIHRVAAHRLILCAAFTSFREAAFRWGVPRRFAGAVPDIWRVAESLRAYREPVLLLHGERDRLFPQRMAEELAACCAAGSQLKIVPELAHNQPFYQPHIAYWGVILEHLSHREDVGARPT